MAAAEQAVTILLLANGSQGAPSQPSVSEVTLDEELSVLSDNDFDISTLRSGTRLTRTTRSKKRKTKKRTVDGTTSKQSALSLSKRRKSPLSDRTEIRLGAPPSSYDTIRPSRSGSVISDTAEARTPTPNAADTLLSMATASTGQPASSALFAADSASSVVAATLSIDSSAASTVTATDTPEATPTSAPAPAPAMARVCTWRSGYVTRKGDRAENQDAYTASEREQAGGRVAPAWGVFDGHGPRGADTAHYAAVLLVQNFYRTLSGTPAAPVQALHASFEQTQTSLLQSANRSRVENGTTACLAFLLPAAHDPLPPLLQPKPISAPAALPDPGFGHESAANGVLSATTAPNGSVTTPEIVPAVTGALLWRHRRYQTGGAVGRLLLGNAGDSRAVLVRRRSASEEGVVEQVHSEGMAAPWRAVSSDERTARTEGACGSEAWRVVLTTVDHTPTLAEEHARCLRHQATMIYGLGPSNERWARVRPPADDPQLALVHGGMHLSLNMSRALGHAVLSRYGVTHVPDVFDADLLPGDRLLIACDGVWEVLTRDEVILQLTLSDDPSAAARALVRMVETRCRATNRKSDNLTAVCVFFD